MTPTNTPADTPEQSLIDAAWQAREQACARYSDFRVGACLESDDGTLYTGCNVESSSYGLTCCAERVALFKALSEGRRRFTRIVVVADTRQPCPPCGACRQLLLDYAPGLVVIQCNRTGRQARTIEELLPDGFQDDFFA
jgi:homotetrameric cytidine deaminase